MKLPDIAKPGQVAIADFLDTETARIDALVARKRKLMRLLEIRVESRRSQVLWSSMPETIPLKYLTPADRPIMYGIVLPGPDVPEGVPIVKGGDVAAGLSRPLCRTTPEIERTSVRSRLRAQDLVVAIRGGIGDIAIVSDEVAGANLTQDAARISPGILVEPRWLLHALRSPEVQVQIARRTTGATIRGLNIEELKLIRVPRLARDDQRAQAFEMDDVESRTAATMTGLTDQVRLLQEHRRALITAAVTGELDTPGTAA